MAKLTKKQIDEIKSRVDHDKRVGATSVLLRIELVEALLAAALKNAA